MRQSSIKYKACAPSDDQDDLIERLHRDRALELSSQHSQTGRVDVPATLAIPRCPPAADNAPIGVGPLEIGQVLLHLRQPRPGQEHVLMKKDDEIVCCLVYCIVIR